MINAYLTWGQVTPILNVPQPKAAQHVAGAAFDVHKFCSVIIVLTFNCRFCEILD